MAQYLIGFYDRFVPAFSLEELKEIGRDARAVIEEMERAGVFVYACGLDLDAPAFSVDARTGEPVFTEGPMVTAAEQFGGLCVVDVDSEEEARFWAGKVAASCRWPQQVNLLYPRFRFDESPAPGAQRPAPRAGA